MIEVFVTSWASKLLGAALACLFAWWLVRLQRKSLDISTREWLGSIKKNPTAAAIYLTGTFAAVFYLIASVMG